MRQLGIALIGFALAFSVVIGASSHADAKGNKWDHAVGIDKVIGACKRTAGCHYDSDGAGEGTGCSPSTCFICHNSKCISVIKGNTKGRTLGGIRLPAGSVQSVSAGKSDGGKAKPTRHPVNIGVAKQPTKIKSDPVASAGKHGGMNQGGGHHH
jgi:hypothetical protein